MKLPRDYSGELLAQALCREFGYERVHQVGSHNILQTETPSHHRLTVPAHADLRIGSLNVIRERQIDSVLVQRDAHQCQ